MHPSIPPEYKGLFCSDQHIIAPGYHNRREENELEHGPSKMKDLVKKVACNVTKGFNLAALVSVIQWNTSSSHYPFTTQQVINKLVALAGRQLVSDLFDIDWTDHKLEALQALAESRHNLQQEHGKSNWLPDWHVIARHMPH